MNSIKIDLIQDDFNHKTNTPGITRITLYFHKDILNILPNILEYNNTDFNNFIQSVKLENIEKVLHNEEGPAWITNDKFNSYFINGQRLSEEEFNKHLHNKKFSDKLNLIID